MTKGDRIRQLREGRSLTQEDLARLLNTKRQTISKYEKNIVTNIPSDKLEELAKVLGTTPEYILGWDDEQKEKPTNPKIGELSEARKSLMQVVQTCPEEKLDRLSAIIQLFLSDEK